MKIKSQTDLYNLGAQDEVDRRLYLSSERYRQTFEDDFPELLKVVNKSDLIDNVQVEEPSIITNDLYKNSLMIRTEYIAGLAYSEWPECANEWIFRERKDKADTISKLVFRWPKQRHITEIHQKHGCTLIPMGYYDPKNPNRIMLIEWQYQFVRAEQILLRSLGHQQIRVLLIIQLLFRDHVEKNQNRVLKPQHLRYILFWLCEHNYRDWQDDRLAVKIKAYLKTLYNALAQGQLPHYFMRKVNLLDNIKEASIRKVQESVKRMNENLPMHLLHTMKRLRYKPDFYPLLDYKKLYPLISAKKYGLEQLNPTLTNAIDDEDEYSEMDSEEERDSEEMRILKRRLHAERERRHSIFLEKVTKKKPIEKTIKKSSVDLNIKINKLNDLRAEKLLSMFASHFIDLAASSNKYGAHPQAMKYLYYAGNLLNILLDEDMKCLGIIDSDVEDLHEMIQEEKSKTRQGLNHMLNYTHKMTDTFEIKMTHAPPKPNWELKKTQDQPKPPTKPKTLRPSQIPQDNPVKGIKKFPGKKEQEKNFFKSLPNLAEGPVLRSIQKSTENESVITFEVASDDDEGSTDL